MDLPTAFVNMLAYVGSADKEWGMAGFGSAGDAILTLVIDESGHIVSRDLTGSPSGALRSTIHKTLDLMGGRPFTARGAQTRLRITGTITKDDKHDGLHGDVFAIGKGGAFTGNAGTAWFALPTGRRIDLQLKLAP
jgi:hypothetical protein